MTIAVFAWALSGSGEGMGLSAQFLSLLLALLANVIVVAYHAGKITARLDEMSTGLRQLGETTKERAAVLDDLRERVAGIEARLRGEQHAT